jgi:DNA-binding NarL/FixJ family response regulator
VILDAEPDIKVVGEAADGQAAIDVALRRRPDVVLMDIRMPELDGIEATRRLMNGDEPRPRVVVLTTFSLDEYVYEALRAGASSFLLKDAPEEQVIGAIRLAAEGGAMFAPAVTKTLIEEFAQHTPRPTAPALDELTERETEVLRLLARGLSNRELADHLVVSEHTAKTHVTRILTKLGLRDRTQAVILAYESGLVRAGDAASSS